MGFILSRMGRFGISLWRGLDRFCDVPDGRSAVRFANAHLIDDETVAKMGHPAV
jgi:hypothetical protein